MVVCPASVGAGRIPGAHPAVLDRVGVRLEGGPLVEDARLEAGLGRAEEGGVVGQPLAMLGAIPGDDHDLPRCHALELGEPVRVDAHLQDRRGLDPARQLGVGDLVAPRPEDARGLDPEQEVGVTAPVAVKERGLEDDVPTGPHGREGLGLGGAQLFGRPEVPGRDLVDRPAGRAQPLEVGGLVRVAALLHQLELGILPERLLPLAGDPTQLERREVVAGQEPDQVRGTDDDRPVRVLLHPPPRAP